jgi:hypothetical protein
VKQKRKSMMWGNQTLIDTDKCLARTNIYKTISEYRMMQGIKLWGIYEVCSGNDTVNGRHYKKIIGVPHYEASASA